MAGFRTITGLLTALMVLMNFQHIHLSGRMTDVENRGIDAPANGD